MAELSDYLDMLFNSDFKVDQPTIDNGDYVLIGKEEKSDAFPKLIIGPRNPGELLNFKHEETRESKYKMFKFMANALQNRVHASLTNKGSHLPFYDTFQVEGYLSQECMPIGGGYLEVPAESIIRQKNVLKEGYNEKINEVNLSAKK